MPYELVGPTIGTLVFLWLMHVILSPDQNGISVVNLTAWQKSPSLGLGGLHVLRTR